MATKNILTDINCNGKITATSLQVNGGANVTGNITGSADYSTLRNKPTTLSGYGITDTPWTNYLPLLNSTGWETGIINNLVGFNSSAIEIPAGASGTHFGIFATLQTNPDYSGALIFRNNRIFFQTREASILQGWNELYHSGNSNKSTIDWNAKVLTSTSLVVNGNTTVTGSVTAKNTVLNNSGNGAEFLRFGSENPFNVTQVGSGSTSELRLNDLSGSKIFRIRDSVNGGNASFKNGTITTTGDITAFSDKRLKSNIQPLQLRGDLNPVTYEKDGKKSIGFIAQEVREVYPELVLGDESKEMLSLNYQQLTAVLYAEIIELKNRLNKLEGENK